MSKRSNTSGKHPNTLFDNELNKAVERHTDALTPASSKAIKGLRHANRHLGKTGTLKHLVQQTDKLVRLNRIMRAYLPPHLQDHARLTAVEEGAWYIQTESSAWATRLRYALPGLQQQLSHHFKRQIPTLKLKVKPALPKTQAVPARRLELTQGSAKHITSIADSVGDERLGAALQRLAAHARKAS